jgi:RNA polymerase sigma-70 factor (ECF subfamily)
LLDFFSDRQFAKGASERIVALRQAKQSVEARQRDIYESHRHRTFALAYYMTANEIEAEQILTDTFVRAFRTIEEPSGPDVDAALLHEFRERDLLPEEAPEPVSQPDACEETAASLEGRNVKRTDLEEAIQYLPAQERLLFLLRDVEGYAPAAIAKLLEMTEQQVNRTLFSARLRLRKVLAEAQQETQKAA